MPGLLVLLAAIVVGYVLLKPSTAEAYVNGEPVTINVASIGGGLVLRDDAAKAWNSMADDAAQAGVTLVPSGPSAAFRSPEQQAALVASEGPFSGSGLAANVGHSPHQAGIAIDVKGCNKDAPDYDGAMHTWLLANCHTYSWTNSGDYFSKKEPWHYEFHPELYDSGGNA